MRSLTTCRAQLLACALVVLAQSADAQWQTFLIRPSGYPIGNALGTRGAEFQFGSASPTNSFSDLHAGIWTGLSGSSWVDLNPPGASASGVLDSDGLQHVGVATFGAVQKAGFWSGTSNSFTSLHPASGYVSSRAVAVGGGRQGGAGTTTTPYERALLWSGSAGSVVSLHPSVPSSRESWISDLSADGETQFGTTSVFVNAFSWRNHASVWHGTAASWTSLSSGSFTDVNGNAISSDGTQFGGQALGAGPSDHAVYWPAADAEPIDLHPGPDYFHSAVEDLDQGYQVGRTLSLGVGFRAALWNGSKESFVDLHAFLPNGFVNSDAYGVWVEDGRVWVAGDAYDSANLTWESVIWEVPEPTSAAGWVFGVAWLTARRKR